MTLLGILFFFVWIRWNLHYFKKTLKFSVSKRSSHSWQRQTSNSKLVLFHYVYFLASDHCLGMSIHVSPDCIHSGSSLRYHISNSIGIFSGPRQNRVHSMPVVYRNWLDSIIMMFFILYPVWYALHIHWWYTWWTETCTKTIIVLNFESKPNFAKNHKTTASSRVLFVRNLIFLTPIFINCFQTICVYSYFWISRKVVWRVHKKDLFFDNHCSRETLEVVENWFVLFRIQKKENSVSRWWTMIDEFTLETITWSAECPLNFVITFVKPLHNTWFQLHITVASSSSEMYSVETKLTELTYVHWYPCFSE